jgi:metal-responsive CopG/Arc/MetJ family transcriptional regulator
MNRLLSVSLSEDLAEEIDALARTLGKTRSEKVVRDALRRQVQVERFIALQRFGSKQAEKRAISPRGAETLVDESRSERR